MSDKKEVIVALHRARKSDSAIAKALSIARCTVWKTLTRFSERRDLSDRPRSDRPRTQTKWQTTHQSKSMIKWI